MTRFSSFSGQNPNIDFLSFSLSDTPCLSSLPVKKHKKKEEQLTPTVKTRELTFSMYVQHNARVTHRYS